MQDIVNNVTGFVGPIASTPLGHALIGLLLLIAGLFLKNIVVGVFRRALQKVADGKRPAMQDLVSPVASLLSAVLTVLVLVAVLEHFNLNSVLEPLKEMVAKFMNAVPNVVGAGVVAYAGWLIAKIVSQVAEFALSKLDVQLAERNTAVPKLAPFGSAFVFGAVLLPVVVSALGVLNIDAISAPASNMISKLMAAVPNLVGAASIVVVTFYTAKFVAFMLDGLLAGMNVDALPAKLGVEGNLFTESFTPRRLIRGALMFFAMLAAVTAAVDMLRIEIISEIFARVLEFGGGLLIGAVILIVGNFLGSVAHRKLAAHGSPGVANIARIAILGLVLAMGLKAMGLADSIVTMAFGFTLGSVAVAAAIAFGIGGRDAAKALSDNWARRLRG